MAKKRPGHREDKPARTKGNTAGSGESTPTRSTRPAAKAEHQRNKVKGGRGQDT